MPTHNPSRPRHFACGATLKVVASAMALVAPIGDLRAEGCELPATIAADRPGNLTMPLVLPVRHLQVEAGWSSARAGDVRARTVGATLLRAGISCGVELRLASGGWVSVDGAGAPARGVADAWLGSKVRLARGRGRRPHVALLTGVLVPTHTASSHHRAEPEANLTSMWELPHAQSAALFTGAARRWTGTDFVVERLNGASWGFPIGSLASFLEYSEFLRPGSANRYVATGLQFFPRASVQLDASVTLPVPRSGADAAFGFGLSRRW